MAKRPIAVLAALALAISMTMVAIGLQPAASGIVADFTGGAIGNAQVAYAKDVKMPGAMPLKKAPKAWKKYLNASYLGHTSGIYHTDFTLKSTTGSWFCAYRIDGMVTSGKTSGKVKCKYKGVQGQCLTWAVTRGKATVYASAYNIPLVVWNAAHGQNTYGLTKKQCKQLLKTATGDKIKYGKLVKWSLAKATSKGLKAEKKYLTKHFAKNIKPA